MPIMGPIGRVLNAAQREYNNKRKPRRRGVKGTRMALAISLLKKRERERGWLWPLTDITIDNEQLR